MSGNRGPREITLPNGMTILCQTRTEAGFIYEDIFVKEVYRRHGVSLADVRTVFDVGGNIGLFTLWVRQRCPRATVYTFEPAPPLFQILRANTASHGDAVRLFNRGLSSRPGTADFTFYFNSSGMSSFYADLAEERQALEAILRNQLRQGMEGMEGVMRHSEDLLEERFRFETFTCQLDTLSRVIRDEGIDRIDLLKIDVQKSEEEVVLGIEPEHWERIRQVVLEVHDVGGRLDRMTAALTERGFQVVAEQDDLYEESPIYNLYAVRPRAGGRASLGRVSERGERLLAAVARQRAELSKEGGPDA
ncbi:MAG TPA: FkbM family methyltransferase [Thermoanaerobaculia bacterium]|nr:FkbM family methyltransferase [Thermoanaerobaculia bacterium]